MTTQQTFTIKQHDTGVPISATLTGSDGTVQDLTGATVRFNMATKDTPAVLKIDHGTCTIDADPTTGVVTYQWVDADTSTVGSYNAEFEVTFSDGTIITFPNDSYVKVVVKAQLG